MLIYRLAKVALAAATLLGQSVAATTLCANPSVRREWRSLTPQERAEWMTAVKCLNSLPHNSSLVSTFGTTDPVVPLINTSSSYFDDWVYIHMDLNPIIHDTAQFLPWHRAYIKDFETALREKCGYTGTQAYWDWRLDAADFANSSIWDPDTTSGIGGWGDPNNDYEITSGAFTDNFTVSYPSYHRLRRKYTPFRANEPDVLLATQITPESQVAIVYGFVGDFIHFQNAFEQFAHRAVHSMVGGDLWGGCPANAPAGCTFGPRWSPNDPIFMLHHAMVDKIWYDWQYANEANFWAFAGGATPVDGGADPTFPNGSPPFVQFSSLIPTDGIMNNYTIYEVMDTKNERMCYIYA